MSKFNDGRLGAMDSLIEDDMDYDFKLTPQLSQFCDGVWDTAEKKWNVKRGSYEVECPLQVILAVVLKAYENNIEVLVKQANRIGENVRLSKCFQAVFAANKWSLGTMQ